MFVVPQWSGVCISAGYIVLKGLSVWRSNEGRHTSYPKEAHGSLSQCTSFSIIGNYIPSRECSNSRNSSTAEKQEYVKCLEA
eukprot:908912-Pelagomonas_calceolata.AAC.2